MLDDIDGDDDDDDGSGGGVCVCLCLAVESNIKKGQGKKIIARREKKERVRERDMKI